LLDRVAVTHILRFTRPLDKLLFLFRACDFAASPFLFFVGVRVRFQGALRVEAGMSFGLLEDSPEPDGEVFSLR